jgi:hypothetical protein
MIHASRVQGEALIAGMAFLGVSLASGAQPCDRTFLAGVVDAYISALVQHDPAKAPLAPDVRFTENTASLKVGDGLWLGASEAPASFKITVVDPQAGQVGLFAVMKENGHPVILVVRLKVVMRSITEVQQFVQRGLTLDNVRGLDTPRRALVTDLPVDERQNREKMIGIANGYFDAIEHNDGGLADFAADCERHESGIQYTGVKISAEDGATATPRQKILTLGCREQVSSNVLAHVSWIWPRGPFLVDRQKGLVMSFPMFVHRGEPREVIIRGVPGVSKLDTTTEPGETQGAEVMKIAGGQIHEVEVAGVKLPYGLPTGWPALSRPK